MCRTNFLLSSEFIRHKASRGALPSTHQGGFAPLNPRYPMNTIEEPIASPESPDGKPARLEVRIGKNEYQVVKEKADTAGLSVSEYARRCVLNRPISHTLSAQQRRELAGMSNNLNQLMQVVHVAGCMTDELETMQQQLRKFLES